MSDEVELFRAQLQERLESAKARLDSAKDREIEKLKKRAQRAENNVAAAIVINAYAAEDADWEILEAISARLLAKNATA